MSPCKHTLMVVINTQKCCLSCKLKEVSQSNSITPAVREHIFCSIKDVLLLNQDYFCRVKLDVFDVIFSENESLQKEALLLIKKLLPVDDHIDLTQVMLKSRSLSVYQAQLLLHLVSMGGEFYCNQVANDPLLPERLITQVAGTGVALVNLKVASLLAPYMTFKTAVSCFNPLLRSNQWFARPELLSTAVSCVKCLLENPRVSVDVPQIPMLNCLPAFFRKCFSSGIEDVKETLLMIVETLSNQHKDFFMRFAGEGIVSFLTEFLYCNNMSHNLSAFRVIKQFVDTGAKHEFENSVLVTPMLRFAENHIFQPDLFISSLHCVGSILGSTELVLNSSIVSHVFSVCSKGMSDLRKDSRLSSVRLLEITLVKNLSQLVLPDLAKLLVSSFLSSFQSVIEDFEDDDSSGAMNSFIACLAKSFYLLNNSNNSNENIDSCMGEVCEFVSQHLLSFPSDSFFRLNRKSQSDFIEVIWSFFILEIEEQIELVPSSELFIALVTEYPNYGYLSDTRFPSVINEIVNHYSGSLLCTDEIVNLFLLNTPLFTSLSSQYYTVKVAFIHFMRPLLLSNVSIFQIEEFTNFLEEYFWQIVLDLDSETCFCFASCLVFLFQGKIPKTLLPSMSSWLSTNTDITLSHSVCSLVFILQLWEVDQKLAVRLIATYIAGMNELDELEFIQFFKTNNLEILATLIFTVSHEHVNYVVDIVADILKDSQRLLCLLSVDLTSTVVNRLNHLTDWSESVFTVFSFLLTSLEYVHFEQLTCRYTTPLCELTVPRLNVFYQVLVHCRRNGSLLSLPYIDEMCTLLCSKNKSMYPDCVVTISYCVISECIKLGHGFSEAFNVDLQLLVADLYYSPENQLSIIDLLLSLMSSAGFNELFTADVLESIVFWVLNYILCVSCNDRVQLTRFIYVSILLEDTLQMLSSGFPVSFHTLARSPFIADLICEFPTQDFSSDRVHDAYIRLIVSSAFGPSVSATFQQVPKFMKEPSSLENPLIFVLWIEIYNHLSSDQRNELDVKTFIKICENNNQLVCPLFLVQQNGLLFACDKSPLFEGNFNKTIQGLKDVDDQLLFDE